VTTRPAAALASFNTGIQPGGARVRGVYVYNGKRGAQEVRELRCIERRKE
jgi:hypothetical protein